MSLLTTVENAASQIPGLSSLKNKSTANVDKFKTQTPSTTDRSIGNFIYPSSLTVDPDLQHWVTFYINVRGKSKIAQDKSLLVDPSTPVPLNGENRVDPSKMSNGVAAAAGVAGALGAVSKLGVGKFFGKIAYARSGSGLGGLAGFAAGTALAAGTAAIATDLAVTPDTTYRLKDAITLHLAQAPSAHYSADYDIVNLGALQGFFDGSSSAVDASKSLGMSIDSFKEIARAGAFAVGGTISSVAAKMEAASKQTLNPFREVLFKSVGFRRFRFDYKFFPKSQQETDQVQKIIQTFRYHMHPELSNGGLFYIHPSEFNIQYYYKGKENTYFNKISTCALVDMHVEYGGQEQFASFADGAPVEITMSLQFQELETLTKERIQKGY